MPLPIKFKLAPRALSRGYHMDTMPKDPCGGKCNTFRADLYLRELAKGRSPEEIRLDFWSCHSEEEPEVSR